MLEEPTLLLEVMSSTSAIAPRWRSSGVATELAMTSGLAPGSDALTKIAGASILGSGATGRSPNATTPHRAMPSVNRVVATGRLMKGAEIFTRVRPPARLPGCAGYASRGDQMQGR